MPFNNALRFKNLFSPDETFNQITRPAPIMRPMPDETINTEIEQPNQERGALSRIYDMMQNVPERGEVNTRGKIGSFLMALGGRNPQDIDRTVQSNYYNRMGDFNAQLDPLLKAGKLESDIINNQSLAGYRMGQVGAANTRAATGQINAQTGQGRLGLAEKSLELKRHLGDRPDTILRKSPGMPDQLIDKRTGRVLAEYESGTLRQDEEEALKQAGRLEIVGAQGSQTRQNIAVQGAVNQAVKSTPSGNVTNQTPAAERRAVLNRLDRIKSAFPALGNVITIDEHGSINISPEVDPDTRDKIMWLLYSDNGQAPPQSLMGPTGVPSPPSNSVPMTGGNNPVNASPIGGSTSNKVKMIRPDGTTRMVSPEHVQIAMQQGFKQVQ